MGRVTFQAITESLYDNLSSWIPDRLQCLYPWM